MRKGESTASAGRKTASPARVRALVFSLMAVLAVILALSILWLGRSYGGLNRAIEKERMDYVAEISKKTIASQHFMKREYSDLTSNYAAILNRANINSLRDIRSCLSSQGTDEILMVTAGGEIYDLAGNAIYLSGQILERLPEGGEVELLFTSLNQQNDYWLFIAKVEPIECMDGEYIAVVMAISADDFRDNLAVSLFDGLGASYIVNNDGSIMIKPAGANLAFDGYNLFSSMIRAGAVVKDVAALQEDMRVNHEGSLLIRISGTDWLINHSAIDVSSSIVAAVPLTVTAAQTYEGLSGTILSSIASVLSVAGITLLLIFYITYRDRQRSREAMAAAAKNDFLAKMSHDIRTPLNAVIGLELLAKDSCENPELVQKYLQQSSAAANYLLSIINDVLDMNRIESGKLLITSQPFDMNAVLSDVTSMASTMAAEKGLIFEAAVDAAFETSYLGDRVRVEQIMMNLLSNAIKFTNAGGSVKLAVTRAPMDDGNDSVVIVVSDTGIGMSREYLSRIFMPFEQERSSYTQEHGGSGLGLSIVHHLVTQMNGSIHVESAKGVGSTFTVTLPLPPGEAIAASPEIERDAEAETEGDEAVSRAFAGRRVLLAEDNRVNRQVAATLLEKKFGVIVDVTEDGRQALERFIDSPEGAYDLVLMDVKMPVMDGLQATRRIRALPRSDAKSVPIVALSANAFEEDVALSLTAGMNAHLSKPIDIRTLGRILRQYIPEKEALS